LRHEVHHKLATTERKPATRWWIAVLLFASIAITDGCATLSIPAFDPSGNRIFAPTPTQFTLPQLHGPTGRSIVPNSSFPEPPPPPACLQGPAAPKAATSKPSADDRGRCGQILLTPTRLVAPVGGEVVLLSGICGEDGYFVSGEPIEWMLDPKGVGEIVEVGDDLKGKRKTFFTSRSIKPVVEKLDVGFARGRTSSEAGRITRGSARDSDDLIIKKGQTWVSLTSPSEGLSRVTVLAPDAEVWDKRRQTATIYWIDASWQFPGNLNLNVGEDATLLTRVTKAEGYKPAQGWNVKYRLLNEGVGQFLTLFPGETVAGTDRKVDADGKAITQLRNATGKPATAIVGIEIEKPGEAEGNMPPLTLARGQVMVSWSAPLLRLTVNSNDTTTVNQPVDFTIVLANEGNKAAENVQLTMNLKNNSLQAIYPNYPANYFTKTPLGASWNIGTIPAGQAFQTIVQINPTAPADNRIDFDFVASPNLRDHVEKPLLVVQPQVGLKFAPARGYEQVEVGQPVVFELLATNTGKQTMNDVTLVFNSDPGLQHENGSNQYSQVIRYLPPGQSQTIGVRYTVRKTGELAAQVAAQVNGVGLGQPIKAFVRGIEPVPRQPAMSVQLVPTNGSTQLVANVDAGLSGIVQNNGQTVLTNVRVQVEYTPSLALTQASQGVQDRRDINSAIWVIPQFNPGTQVKYDMAFRAIAGSPPPKIRISSISAEGTTAQFELPFTVADGSSEPSVLPGRAPDSSSSVLPPLGNAGSTPSTPWSMSLVPLDQTIPMRSNSRFALKFRNNRPTPDQDVRIEFALPQGVRVLGVTSGGTPVPGEFGYSSQNSLMLQPLQSVGSGEEIEMVLELGHDTPGTQELVASIRSAAMPQPMTQRARINVTPR
jgi:Domain of unknown function DUF11